MILNEFFCASTAAATKAHVRKNAKRLAFQGEVIAERGRRSSYLEGMIFLSIMRLQGLL